MSAGETINDLMESHKQGKITEAELNEGITRLTEKPIKWPKPVKSAQRKQEDAAFFATGVMGVLLMVLAVWYFFIYTPTPRHVMSDAEFAQQQADEKEAKTYGMSCVSGWDHSYKPLVQAVTATLRDPGSFQHITSETSPVDAKGNNTVSMSYRAKNGFGGYVTGLATADFDNRNCSMVNWSKIGE